MSDIHGKRIISIVRYFFSIFSYLHWFYQYLNASCNRIQSRPRICCRAAQWHGIFYILIYEAQSVESLADFLPAEYKTPPSSRSGAACNKLYEQHTVYKRSDFTLKSLPQTRIRFKSGVWIYRLEMSGSSIRMAVSIHYSISSTQGTKIFEIIVCKPSEMCTPYYKPRSEVTVAEYVDDVLRKQPLKSSGFSARYVLMDLFDYHVFDLHIWFFLAIPLAHCNHQSPEENPPFRLRCPLHGPWLSADTRRWVWRSRNPRLCGAKSR